MRNEERLLAAVVLVSGGVKNEKRSRSKEAVRFRAPPVGRSINYRQYCRRHSFKSRKLRREGGKRQSASTAREKALSLGCDDVCYRNGVSGHDCALGYADTNRTLCS